jgi:hypothetical protein
MKYNVVFETRSRNAIGYFYPFHLQVEANNQEEAYRLAMEQCHARNLETRFPIRCEEYVETTTLLDLCPEYNSDTFQWDVRETDENDNTLEVYSFITEVEAENFIDNWIKKH